MRLTKVDNIIIAIFKKLFAIKIVANKRFGRSSNESVRFESAVFFLRSESISFVFKEKKAISEPETMAEVISSITIIATPIIASGVSSLKKVVALIKKQECNSGMSSKVINSFNIQKY